MNRKSLFIALAAAGMVGAGALAFAADESFPGLGPRPAPASDARPQSAPPAKAAVAQAPSGPVTATPDVLDSAISKEFSDLSNEAARAVMKNEIGQRVLASQVSLMKTQVELAKATAEAAKARGETNAAAKQAIAAAGGGPGGDPNANQLPAMSVTWIAGPTENPQAQIKIAKYGSIVVRKGSRVPAANGMTVDRIDSHGVLIKDATGQTYPVSFGG